MKSPRATGDCTAQWPQSNEYNMTPERRNVPKKDVEYGQEGDMAYPLDNIEDQIIQEISQHTGQPVSEIKITPPPPHVNADYAVQLTTIGKEAGTNPVELAKQVAERLPQIQIRMFEAASAQGPYLNFRLEMGAFGTDTVNQILHLGSDYGKENTGHGGSVVVDMSSPNIAKEMSYGHLRSTIIGDAVSRLHEAMGYAVTRDNHIGDWGTQFGKLIVAIRKWGGDVDQLMISENPIAELQKLYVKFHDEADLQATKLREDLREKLTQDGEPTTMEELRQKVKNVNPQILTAVNEAAQTIIKRKKISEDELDIQKIMEDALDKAAVPPLEEEGREAFAKLEQGDPEARKIWKVCIDLSMKEFEEVYQILGVNFDVVYGESFYEEMLDDAIKAVQKSGAAKRSKGALIVDLEDQGLGTAVIQKSDGSSLYITRDIATAIYRQDKMGADKAVYVVGEDQRLYFKQLFEILKRMDYPIGETSEHVYFGMVRLPEGKMSTRKGKTIPLKEVIGEAFARAEDILKDKNPELYNDETKRQQVVRQIAVAAIKWNDLGQDPKKEIVFNLEKAVNLTGYSGPFVQYAAVRANKIIEASQLSPKEIADLSIDHPEAYESDSERDLVKALAEYPRALKEAFATSNPSKLAAAVYDVASRFNAFYENSPVLKAENEADRKVRLKLVAATSQVITNGLTILGIEVPQAM